jgi:hypothetical protein
MVYYLQYRLIPKVALKTASQRANIRRISFLTQLPGLGFRLKFLEWEQTVLWPH